jgi:hypothetical protein
MSNMPRAADAVTNVVQTLSAAEQDKRTAHGAVVAACAEPALDADATQAATGEQLCSLHHPVAQQFVHCRSSNQRFP